MAGLSASAAVVVLRRAGEEIEDAELVRRASGGDAWAEEALYRRHAGRVYSVVLRLIGGRADAEDVVQEAFVIAFERLGELREPGAFAGWLVRIGIRQVYRKLRRRRLGRLFGLGHQEESTVPLRPSDTASAEQKAQIGELARVLAELSDRDRIPWILHHVEGYTLEEVAVAARCSLATAKRRIAAAHARVQRHVNEVGS